MSTKFEVTPDVEKAIQFVLENCELSEKEREEFENAQKEGKTPHKAGVTLHIVQRVSEHLKKKKELAEEKKVPIYLFEILRGSLPKVREKPPKVKNAEFEKKMEEVRKEWESKLYRKMVQGIVRTTEVDKMRDKRELKDFNSQMSIGLNLIVTRVALFAAGFFIGKTSTGDSFWG